jgi:GxxExxY protein
MNMNVEELNPITEQIIGAAIEVHRELGPGLLESAYKICLAHELRSRGCTVVCEQGMPVIYRGTTLDTGYRVDLVVEDSVLVEVKAVRELPPIFVAQTLTYLKFSGKRLALLINFNVQLLKDGIRRLAR